MCGHFLNLAHSQATVVILTITEWDILAFTQVLLTFEMRAYVLIPWHACRWVSAQMDFSTTALLGTTVLVATGAKSLMSAPLVALALTHVLQLSGTINVCWTHLRHLTCLNYVTCSHTSAAEIVCLFSRDSCSDDLG